MLPSHRSWRTDLDEIRVGTLIGVDLVEGCVELLEVLLERVFHGFDLVVDLAKMMSLDDVTQ